MCPIMAPWKVVVRPPVSIRVGEAARVEPLFIDRLFVDARLNEYALLAVNGRCLMIVVMMLDDFPTHNWSRDVMMLDDFTMHDGRADVTFLQPRQDQQGT